MKKLQTDVDKPLKTNYELIELVAYRMSLPFSETVKNLNDVEAAIGALFVGQYFGLRILRIIHSSSILRKYEKFLGVSFEELIPQHGPLIDKSVAWSFISTTKEYWDVVSRKFSLPDGVKRAVFTDT